MALENQTHCVAVLTRAYESFFQGYFDDLMEWMSPSVMMRIVAPPIYYPYHGTYFGKDAVLAAWKSMQVEFNVLDYRVLDVIKDDERSSAAVRHWCKVRHHGTSMVTTVECHDQLRTVDGYVVSITSYVDSVRLAIAAGLELPLPMFGMASRAAE